MSCPNCMQSIPGSLIKATKDLQHCAICGRELYLDIKYLKEDGRNLWDHYFKSVCIAVASKSPCLSRKIGAILVKDHSIVSTGYNGPARGIPHCGRERFENDNELTIAYFNDHDSPIPVHRFRTECPRKVLGYPSGTHMELCPAQHAEENCISNAARLGVPTIGTTLYMNCIVPCKNCFGTLINAGIVEIVVDKVECYDVHTQYLITNSNIKIRPFETH